MPENKIFQLVNLSTGQIISRLNDAQVDDLKTHLEQESATDTSFYITPEAIEFLRAGDASELANLLATALGDAQGIPIGYAPIYDTGSMRVSGRLLALDNNRPRTGYKIEIYDEDIVLDDFLGWCYSDVQGKFELRFDESAFKDSAFEGKPELKLRILDIDGAEVDWIGILRVTEADVGDVFVSESGKLIAPILDPTAAAICVKCGALYRSGFSTCGDCQISLRPLGVQRRQ